MGSLGGLDVAYGSNMQIVKTNVLCLALATTGLANSTTVPKFILNTYKQALKGSIIEPDFLYVYEITDVDGSGFATAGAADNLFNQDNTGDGSADTTALEVGGVLRDIRQCPLKVNSAYADTTAAHAAEGAAHTLHTYDNIHGNLAMESVLQVSGVALNDTAAVDSGVFADANAADVNVGADTAGMFAQHTEALAMKEVYDDAMASTGGNLDAESKTTGGHRGPYTLDLSLALLQLESGTGIATGATASDVDAITASTTMASIANTCATDMGIISVTSIAKIC